MKQRRNSRVLVLFWYFFTSLLHYVLSFNLTFDLVLTASLGLLRVTFLVQIPVKFNAVHYVNVFPYIISKMHE